MHVTLGEVFAEIVLRIALASVIGGNALRRGDRARVAFFWAAWTFLVPCLTPFFYLHYRFTCTHSKPKPTAHCKYCGALIVGQPAYCPACSRQLRGSEEIHGK